MIEAVSDWTWDSYDRNEREGRCGLDSGLPLSLRCASENHRDLTIPRLPPLACISQADSQPDSFKNFCSWLANFNARGFCRDGTCTLPPHSHWFLQRPGHVMCLITRVINKTTFYIIYCIWSISWSIDVDRARLSTELPRQLTCKINREV